MPIKCEQYNQTCVISTTGDLEGDGAVLLRKAVEEQVDQKQIVDFVIDLEKCGFIDSEGLETLLWLKRRCDELFGQIKLVSLDENCRKILEITRLEHRFDCQAELTGALKMMR